MDHRTWRSNAAPSTDVEQVAKNVRKALKAGRRCRALVPTSEAADRVARVIGTNVPEAHLWNEFGLLWREGGSFHPYPGHGGDALAAGCNGSDGASNQGGAACVITTTPSRRMARRHVHGHPCCAMVARAAGLLQAEGKRWVTFDDF